MTIDSCGEPTSVPQHIVFLGPRLGFQGGIERHAHDLAVALKERGLPVSWLFDGEESNKGEEPERFRQAFKSVAHIQSDEAKRVLQLADVVYVHKARDARWLELVSSRGKVFVAAHDHDFSCPRRHRYVPLSREPCHRTAGLPCVTHGCFVTKSGESKKRLMVINPFDVAKKAQFLAQRSSFITCSQYIKNGLVAMGVTDSTVYVLHPCPPDVDASCADLPQGERLGFFGQVIRGKGLDLLLHALVHRKQASLLVVGDGPNMPEMKRLADQLRVSDRITWAGFVPSDRIHRYYDQVRLVVVPSRWPEPFGMVGIEAMRRKRVVVAARHGGIPEWLGEPFHGVGFHPLDVPSLVSAIETAMERSKADVLLERTRQYAHDVFSHTQMVQRLLTIFSS